MIRFNNKYRSTQEEVMDDFNFDGLEMEHVLKDLQLVNKWLGGNNVTIRGLQKLLKNHPRNKPLIILDVGCGDGELLRICSDFGKKNNFIVECIGIDFNKNILKIAEEKSFNYSNITFKNVDIFLDENLIPNCDIALCTLFLHHFNNTEIESILKVLLKKSNKGVLVNDLHRHKLAFNLFKIVGSLFLKTKISKHDGLISIARSFKRWELVSISEKINNQRSCIKWCWAFRFQWILNKNI